MTTPIRKGAGQSAQDMAGAMIEAKTGNHLYQPQKTRKGSYNEISNELKAEALDSAIDHQLSLLQRVKERGRIDLDNLDEVSATAEEYMKACKTAGVYPSMLGFAAAAGYSRVWIYHYINTNNNEVARYLDNLRSAWAAIIQQMALSRQCSEATAIFILKNSGQGLTDKTELDINTSSPYRAPEPTIDDIIAKYQDIIDIPEEY